MSPMRVLVIEDDREAASYIAKGLGESGHTVDVVGDAPGDLTGDGVVDVLDLVEAINNWGNPYGVEDLIEVITNWD